MALNKFMHPRNIYKTPPDFVKMANKYPEFAGIVKTDVTGKVNIDFKDPNSLRILTKCLLQSDFNLKVNIPEDRLVPTLPLRLNYVLWIEDLLNSLHRTSNVHGLDIGTGACAIFPLLAVAMNKWHIIGTETDKQSFVQAQENVKQNNLEAHIEIVKNASESVIDHFLSNYEGVLDFCMCNPPFYSTLEELYESRSTARLPPKNGFTGSPQELITEGGEVEFCRKLIKESKQHRNKIMLFTTMLGHKFNMHKLVEDLKLENIKHTTTEFCQGRVTRWGLAWTYQDYDLSILVPPRIKSRKKNIPILYELPELPNVPYDIENVIRKITTIFNDLSIKYKTLNKRGNNICFDIIAVRNTWSNQRRKRRQTKRFDNDEAKKIKLDSTDANNINSQTHADTSKEIFASNSDCNGDISCDIAQAGTNITVTTSENANLEPVIHAFARICKKDKIYIVEFEYLGGCAGKEGLHQVVQYIKNNWK